LDTVKLSSKGQIVIPKEIRDAKHWRTGTTLVITMDGQGLRLAPAPLTPATRTEDGLGLLARARRKRMSEEQVARAVRRRARHDDEATKA